MLCLGPLHELLRHVLPWSGTSLLTYTLYELKQEGLMCSYFSEAPSEQDSANHSSSHLVDPKLCPSPKLLPTQFAPVLLDCAMRFLVSGQAGRIPEHRPTNAALERLPVALLKVDASDVSSKI